jgi:hypothetical protein
MMKSALQFVLAAILLVAVGPVGVALCEIVNGSFEDDGSISDIAQSNPTGWSADVSTDKFAGRVSTDWPTDGLYSLRFYSLYARFEAGDAAAVSQNVDLSNVDGIIFDVKVDSDRSAWDPNVCSAVVMIDGDVVWTSDAAVPNDQGELIDQLCPVESKYRTAGPHELSLGLRVNQTGWLWERYYTDWDFVELAMLCGGGGLLPGDFNGDCFVDVNDLMTMGIMWLAEVPADSPYNLSAIDDDGPDATVNGFDFAVFGGHWLGSSLVQAE